MILFTPILEMIVVLGGLWAIEKYRLTHLSPAATEDPGDT